MVNCEEIKGLLLQCSLGTAEHTHRNADCNTLNTVQSDNSRDMIPAVANSVILSFILNVQI